jgi:hypothetical protein
VAAKKNMVTVNQAIIDPITLALVGYQTVDAGSAQGKQLKAAAEEHQASLDEQAEADKARQAEADKRAEGIEPTVGDVRAEQRGRRK